LAPGSSRRDVILASALKLALMPLVAWLVGGPLFHLPAPQLFAVVVLAALPTAQNVFNYAQRYERGEIFARDVVLVTTVLCVPVLVLIAALLA
jgi:predicted permease